VVLCRTTLPRPEASLFTDAGGPVTVVVSEAADSARVAALEAIGARVLRYSLTDGLAGALAVLAADGVDDLMVEAGPTLLTGLWQEQLIDELVVVTAGGMGGPQAPPMFAGDADCSGDVCVPVLEPIEVGIVRSDAVAVWRPRSESAAERGKGSVD
jgi:riboflavin biosynthesis pyrimidine reductase